MMNKKDARLPHANRQKVQFFWNGRSVEGRSGESVATALLANGIRTLAWTRKFHRPMGYSGSYVNGVLARVNDVPNVRIDLMPVTPGLRVEMQNCWPNARFNLLRLARFIPSSWIQGGFEHTNLVPSGSRFYERWEGLLAFLAGVANPANRRGEVTVPAGRRIHANVLIIGGGPSGCLAANEAAAKGKSVVLVTRGEKPARYATSSGNSQITLDIRVQTLFGVEVFGAYREGSLLLGAHHDSSKGAIVFEGDEILLATGRRAVPPVVPGIWLPGSMDARTAILMARDQAVAPGTRVVVLGSGQQHLVAERLRKLGVNVVTAEPIGNLRRVLGRKEVRGVVLDRNIRCDCLVYAGPWVSDRSLSFQSGSEGLLQLYDKGTSRLRLIGSAAEVDEDVPVASRSRHAGLLCPCFDVSTREVDALISQGVTDLEIIKRLTSCGMGPCQGQPCWDSLLAFVSQRTGLPPSHFAKPSQRPPRRALTVAQAAGLTDVVEPLQ
jgi:sarcosine oxidase subunit alpha